VPKKENIFFIPNAFIPGRGNNPEVNTFKVYGPDIKEASMKIYNSWGQCIFESTNARAKGWDGKYKGLLQPSGSYVYAVKIIFEDNTGITKTGTVNLVR
jgi:gliding motility-associated-like protein